ncbi:23347_t:CDS:1, partial [Gigaspora margarita]
GKKDLHALSLVQTRWRRGTPGIIIIRYRRIDKTHKEEGIVRANTLTKRKSTLEDEHEEIFEENMAKQLNKKQK